MAQDGPGFVTSDGRPFVPFGVTYYRPGTGWAPQVWKKFDADATRADFARMKEMGVNCVRVFLSYGSFLTEPDRLAPEGLAKFDQFLEIAQAAGIYVHPTGPDHWEGVPDWAKGDRIADDKILDALESFWRLFAARYRGRNVLFAYDLRNEPEVAWDNPTMQEKWNRWVERTHDSLGAAMKAWGMPDRETPPSNAPIPEAKDSSRSPHLLDYQRFREEIADEWTRRQVVAIKAADPAALVTVGFIQWSIPCLLPGVSHYAAFRPSRQAPFLDFLEVHFYPLERGFYEYDTLEQERRNLAYLECVVAETARPGKPVVVAEFGWHGGGQLTIDQGKHRPATDEQQARWCTEVIHVTDGLAAGWLNWGFYDQPEARDVSQLTGLLTAGARIKAWGQEFRRLAPFPSTSSVRRLRALERPVLDWDLCVTSVRDGNAYRDEYYRACEAGR
jgi:hypothetical protein